MSIAETSCKWGKKTIKTLAMLLTLNTAVIPVSYLINRNITPDKKTIVFTSGKNDLSNYGIPEIPSEIMVLSIDFFMYNPITIRQNLRGNQINWCSNPNLETFIEKLQNPEFENIVLIGHGGKNNYALLDGDADTDYLKKFWLPNRQGEFYQYTCGGDEEEKETLKDVLFNPCARSKTFGGILDPFTSYVCAWTDSADEEDNY